MDKKDKLISIIIVSHGHGDLVYDLIESIDEFETKLDLEIVLLENLKSGGADISKIGSRAILQIVNEIPKGLSENVNNAVSRSSGEYICIVNPDVRFVEPVLEELKKDIDENRAAIIAPKVVDESGVMQDSYRKLPNLFEQMIRYITKKGARKAYDIEGKDILYPDWIAGMFSFMKRETFVNLGGFDEKYVLYLEDLDFCCRAKLEGYQVAVDLTKKVIHDARRESRGSGKFLFMHLKSSLKFYFSAVYWKTIFNVE